LSCWSQALLCLVWFRERRDVAFDRPRVRDLPGHRIPLLRRGNRRAAAQAPDLTEALERVAGERWSHVVLDGKLVATDRLSSIKTSTKGKLVDAWYSGKSHGLASTSKR
jgi:hypothetical protein